MISYDLARFRVLWQRHRMAWSQMHVSESCIQNYHSDKESDRNVNFFHVFAEIHFESIRLGHRFQHCKKSVFDGFFWEAAILENFEDWGGDWAGQPRSSQPEEEF